VTATWVVSCFVAISLVLPGFIIADLAEARRAQRSARSDWELVLRALIYALVLQSLVLLTGLTTQLIDTAGLLNHAKSGMTPTWEHHVHAIALYVVVVILLAPTIIGLRSRLGSGLRGDPFLYSRAHRDAAGARPSSARTSGHAGLAAPRSPRFVERGAIALA
jgi:hypothetical protein